MRHEAIKSIHTLSFRRKTIAKLIKYQEGYPYLSSSKVSNWSLHVTLNAFFFLLDGRGEMLTNTCERYRDF